MAKGNSRRIEDILNNPSDKSKLDNSIDEYVRLLDSIKDKKESMKVIVDDIREKIEIDPKNPRYIKVMWGVGYKMDRISN